MTKPATSPCGFRVEAETVAVPEARQKIFALVRNWDLPLPDESLHKLELLSSEVITNALRYSEAACAVAVRWTGIRVRVEVTDASPVRPKPRHGSVDAEGGRGLLLVDALAADWGSTDDPAGKVVWFEVGAREQPPPWSAPGTWTITTTDGAVHEGYLPDWAEDDPTEVDVPPEELGQRLALVNHRTFFEGPLMPVTDPDLWDGPRTSPSSKAASTATPTTPTPAAASPSSTSSSPKAAGSSDSTPNSSPRSPPNSASTPTSSTRRSARPRRRPRRLGRPPPGLTQTTPPDTWSLP